MEATSTGPVLGHRVRAGKSYGADVQRAFGLTDAGFAAVFDTHSASITHEGVHWIRRLTASFVTNSLLVTNSRRWISAATGCGLPHVSGWKGGYESPAGDGWRRLVALHDAQFGHLKLRCVLQHAASAGLTPEKAAGALERLDVWERGIMATTPEHMLESMGFELADVTTALGTEGPTKHDLKWVYRTYWALVSVTLSQKLSGVEAASTAVGVSSTTYRRWTAGDCAPALGHHRILRNLWAEHVARPLPTITEVVSYARAAAQLCGSGERQPQAVLAEKRLAVDGTDKPCSVDEPSEDLTKTIDRLVTAEVDRRLAQKTDQLVRRLREMLAILEH